MLSHTGIISDREMNELSKVNNISELNEFFEDNLAAKIPSSIINFFHTHYADSTISNLTILKLLSLAEIQNFTIYEILNYFSALKTIFQHIDYYDCLIKEDSYGERIEDEIKTRRFMNSSSNKPHNYLIGCYKTKSAESNKILDMSFRDKNDKDDIDIYYREMSEKRRMITIDHKGYFNYIPLQCIYKTHSAIDENCPFAHNMNEILYHPLLLKTLRCRKDECLLNCPFSHPLDYRNLFNKRSPSILKLIQLTHNYKLFCDANINHQINESQLKEIIKPKKIELEILNSEFHPESYKTKECPLGIHCRLDRKLCLNYHSLVERRRDFHKFKYEATNCPTVYQNRKYLDPRHCEKGDECNNCHTIYEFMYAKHNFRSKPCPIETKGKSCEYLIICPFRHSKDIIDFEERITYSDKTLKYYKDIIRMNIDNVCEKNKSLKKVVDYHNCFICENSLKQVYNIRDCCKKIICNSCSEKKGRCCEKERNYKEEKIIVK